MRYLIAKARANGQRLSILTNEIELFYELEPVRRMQLLEQLDTAVAGTHTQILKPDPRAYTLTLTALEPPAGEVLFVDDQLRDIVGANKADLRTQLFELRDVPGSLKVIFPRLRLTDAG